jgi:hypothetical protein
MCVERTDHASGDKIFAPWPGQWAARFWKLYRAMPLRRRSRLPRGPRPPMQGHIYLGPENLNQSESAEILFLCCHNSPSYLNSNPFSRKSSTARIHFQKRLCAVAASKPCRVRDCLVDTGATELVLMVLLEPPKSRLFSIYLLAIRRIMSPGWYPPVRKVPRLGNVRNVLECEIVGYAETNWSGFPVPSATDSFIAPFLSAEPVAHERCSTSGFSSCSEELAAALSVAAST